MHIYAIAVAQIFYGWYIMNTFKTYGSTHIDDDRFLTLIGSVAAVVNGGMRIFWSSLLDYYPFRKVNSFLMLIQVVTIATIVPASQNKGTYMLVVALGNMTEGAIAAIIPTLTLQKFGLIRGHDVYSYIYSAFGLSALLGSIIVGLIADQIGFKGMLVICMGFSIVAWILTLRLDDVNIFDYVSLYNKYKPANKPEIVPLFYKNKRG